MSAMVAMVASPGGHIDQAFEIADRFASRDNRFWITARTPQTEALLARERVEWVPQVRSRQGLRAARTFGLARRIMRRNRPDRVVSTGSALAVPYMLAARSSRIAVTYVESATRLLGPSVTGRIVERVPGIELFCQGRWERPRWAYFGSIFDGYAALTATPRPVENALVTIGSEQFPFARALESARDATAGLTVSWQTGTTPTEALDLPGDSRAWWPGDELASRANDADIVITHAGVGSILMVLRTGSCPVVIPRLQELGEHIDNHQLELATVLESRDLVVVARPEDDLADCVRRAASRRITKAGPGDADNR